MQLTRARTQARARARARAQARARARAQMLAQAQAQVVQDMSWQLPTLSDPLVCLHQACLPERK